MNEIDKWLSSGAEVNEGLRLQSIYAPSVWLERLVKASPRHAYLLRDKLLPFSESRRPKAQAFSETYTEREGYGSSFRKKWPFLSDPLCPQELKVLAADMITSWHNYVDEHERLYSQTTAEDCFQCARKLLENYSENRKILSEFTYFKMHGSALGKHPIFGEMKRLNDLRRLPVSELFRRQKNLRGAIWRINHEVGKKDRPDLDAERAARLESKMRELEEVNQMISDYERRTTG